MIATAAKHSATGLLPMVAALLLLLIPDRSMAQSAPYQQSPRLEGLPIQSITIHGLENLEEDVVRRRLELTVGAPFSHETARRDERAITGLMLFWSVRIVAVGAPAGYEPRAVEVHVNLEERFALFAAPQMDWSPEEGWSCGAFGGHLNLARRGHRFYISGMAGGAGHLEAVIHNPWNGPHHESFAIRGTAVRIRNRLYNSKESGERLSLELGRWFGRTGRGKIGLLYRAVEGKTPSWYAPAPETPFRHRMHLLRLTLGHDTTDPWGHPRLGLSTVIRLEQYGGPLGGDFKGGAVRARAIRRQLIVGDLVLASLFTLDTEWGDIPFWRLLTVGGPNSIRGYPLGEYLVDRRWEITGELQWYVVPMQIVPMGVLGDQIMGISLSLFTDGGAGGGVRRSSQPEPRDDRTPTLVSWGAGCYFHNALFGTLRVELAWPERGHRRFIFGLGTKF